MTRLLAPGPVSPLAIATAPAVSMALAVLLLALPVPLAGGALPDLPLLLLIAWGGLQPRLLPSWAAFLLGLLADAIMGLPLGVMATTYAGVRIAIGFLEERAPQRTLWSEWLSAAAFVMLALFLEAAALLIADRAVALAPMLVRAAISIAVYPVALALVVRLMRRILEG